MNEKAQNPLMANKINLIHFATIVNVVLFMVASYLESSGIHFATFAAWLTLVATAVIALIAELYMVYSVEGKPHKLIAIALALSNIILEVLAFFFMLLSSVSALS